jgi:hypothetical protein
VTDGGVPYAVDVVADTGRAPTGRATGGIALSPAGRRLNSLGDFFAPRDRNPANPAPPLPPQSLASPNRARSPARSSAATEAAPSVTVS